MPKREIRRGEIYWADWTPARGSEQRGVRPSLVIQNDAGNRASSTTIIASISTVLERPYRFLVRITVAESGLQQDSTVNLSSTLTITQERLGAKCGELSRAKMAEVDAAVRVSLAL